MNSNVSYTKLKVIYINDVSNSSKGMRRISYILYYQVTHLFIIDLSVRVLMAWHAFSV